MIRHCRAAFVAGPAAVLVVGAAFLGGCGSSVYGVAGGGTFLSVSIGATSADPSDALLLEFTTAHGQLDGTADYAYLSPGATSVVTHSGTISGTVSTTSIALNDEDDTFAGGNLSGQVSGSTFTLAIPKKGGKLVEVGFSPASVASYNAALAALNHRAEATLTAKLAAAEQVAAAAHAKAVADAQAQLKAVCGSSCPPLLSSPAADYEPLVTFGPGATQNLITFAGVPLEVCWAVASASVTSLTYEIGNPVAGPRTLFDASGGPAVRSEQGCVSDPGNDNGLTPVVTTAGGSGSWVVQIDQQGTGPLPAAVTSPSAMAACDAIGGTPSALSSGSASCEDVSYFGPDGATYYVNLPLDTSGPEPVDMQGTAANEEECRTGSYPMANPGVNTPGHWDAALDLCLSAGTS